jgi:hypothetical protein
MEVLGEHHALAALLPGKSRYPLNRRLGGPQSRPGRYGENKNVFPLPGFDPGPSSQ